MRSLSVLLYRLLFLAPITVLAAETPMEWIDADTGHRVVRLSQEAGSASLYFHQNAYSPDGKKLIVTTPNGVATIDLATRVIDSVVKEKVSVIVAGRKSGLVYYSKRVPKETTKADGTKVTTMENVIFATHLDTKITREIVKLPRGGIASINADETLMLGSYVDGDAGIFARDGGNGRPDAPAGAAAATFQADYQAKRPDGTPFTFAEAKEVKMNEQLERRLPRTMFTVNIATGEIKTILQSTDWLGHLQFSPTDPGLIMFCHEGPWHKVDRIWTMRTDGSALTKIHTRTMNMEIAGHEFFSADGKTIWYDLQTPRGEDFWVAGYELATGRRTWWHLQRDEWSVHFNVSPDGSLFVGDGGDDEMVAHAKDGKWIYLLKPQRIPDVAGIKNPDSANLIDPGFFQSERLVNLSKHNYKLEPNVTFTPDMKWVIFRSNMSGEVHTYAVEVAKAR